MSENQIRALNAQLYFLAFLAGGWKALLIMIFIHYSSLVWDLTISEVIEFKRGKR